MSSALEHDENDRQPPSKRQRILPERTRGAGTASSSLDDKTRCAASASASPTVPSTEYGPVFTDVEDTEDDWCNKNCSSIESALGVPTKIIFRRVGGDRKEPTTRTHANEKQQRKRPRPLLSRQEAEQFLRLTLVVQEIDVLVDLSETVLSRRRFARRFRHGVLMQRGDDADTNDPQQNAWKNPWLTTLGPILDVLEQRQILPDRSRRMATEKHQPPNFPQQQQQQQQHDILHHIHNQMMRLCHELQACGVYEMERSAEQNRSLVASLTDILGYHTTDDLEGEREDDGNEIDGDDDDGGRTSAVRALAQEKHALSKLQELLSKRARSLLVMLCFPRTPSTDNNTDDTGDDGKKSGCDANIDSDSDNDNDNHTKQILFYEEDSSGTASMLPRTGRSNRNKSKAWNHSASNNDHKFLTPRIEHSYGNNNSDGDEESSLLSLEEILIPIEVVCDQLFARGGRKTNITTPVGIQNQNKCTIESLSDRATEKEDKPPMAEKMGFRGTEDKSSSSLLEAASRIATRTTETASLPVGSLVENSSDVMKVVAVEASQRTVGAAVAMMTLATNSDKSTLETKRNGNHLDNHSMRVAIGTLNRKNAGLGTQQYLGKNHDDDSFVEDPPTDGEVGNAETSNNDQDTSAEDKPNNVLGIFDVVDVLTPQSQLPQQETQLPNNETRCISAHDGNKDDRG